MNSLRPKDIYCDPCPEKHATKAAGPTCRPVKSRNKQHRVERKTQVRRNLFGPVDHEDTENFLKKELDILADLSNRKWNFDFSKEKPLDGQWLWEPVGSNDPTVPSAYRCSLHVDDRQAFEVQRSSCEVPVVLGVTSDRANVSVESRGSCSAFRVHSSMGQTKSREMKRKETTLQPSLKGFLTVKKRKLNLSSDNTKNKGVNGDSSSTLLNIIKPVSPTKPFVSKNNVAVS